MAYENSAFRSDGGFAAVNGDTFLLGTTLRYQTGPWEISGALDASYGRYDSQRYVQVGNFRAAASADPSLWQIGAHGRVAYQIPLGGWYLQPRVDLHLMQVSSAAYTETGAGPFDLSIEGHGYTVFVTEPTLEFGGEVALPNGAVLRPFISAGLEISANNDWTTGARFAGQPDGTDFETTVPVPDMLGRFNVGASLVTSKNWDLTFRYSAEVGDGYLSQAGLGQMSYRF